MEFGYCKRNSLGCYADMTEKLPSNISEYERYRNIQRENYISKYIYIEINTNY